MLHRRDLLNSAVTTGAASLLLSTAGQTAQVEPTVDRLVDSNVSLFQWPCRRLPLDHVADLVDKLSQLGVTEAWAGSFESLLHRDVAGVNRRLVEACRKHPMLKPIGCINPSLPGWEDDLEQCIDQFDMLGVRLHPNYHGYSLEDPAFTQIVERVAAAGRLLQVAVSMEDIRTQHPLLLVTDVDVTPLPGLLRERPGVRVQLLNHRLRGAILEQLGKTNGIYFDTARVDGTDGVRSLIDSVPIERVLFGSHSPFLIPEAALIRVHESDLEAKPLVAVLAGNAEQTRAAQ
jgi:predicted TIM-barrel fold metal-dependent hydrolase